MTRRAVALLLDQGAEMLLHLGDVGGVEVIDTLAVQAPVAEPRPGGSGPDAGQLEAHVVFGNTDWDLPALTRYAQSLGIMVDHPVGSVDVEAGRLAFCHGHEPAVLAQALAAEPRYLCHGHTHQTSDTRQRSTRVINPGALHRAREHTVALLDTTRDELRFLTLPPR